MDVPESVVVGLNTKHVILVEIKSDLWLKKFDRNGKIRQGGISIDFLARKKAPKVAPDFVYFQNQTFLAYVLSILLPELNNFPKSAPKTCLKSGPNTVPESDPSLLNL